MTTSVNLLSPIAGMVFACRSGNSYTADANGFVTAVVIGDIIELLNGGCTFVNAGRNNFIATAAPTTTNDSSQDYVVGSRWFNTSSSLSYTCLSAAVGAAVWLLDGAVPGVGVAPSNMLAGFGNGTGSFKESGTLNVQAGNPLAANLADLTDDIIAGFAIPASSFDVAGRVINIMAQGQTAATANNKTIKLWINPTMSGQTVTNGNITGGTVTAAGSGVNLITTGVITLNNKGWQIYGTLWKYGAAASNTQLFQGGTVLDTTHGGIGSIQALTQTESAIMNIVITGASGTTGAANDVKISLFELTASN